MIHRQLLTLLTAGGIIVQAQAPSLCPDTFAAIGAQNTLDGSHGVMVANNCGMLDFVINTGVCSNYGAMWHSTNNVSCSSPPELYPPAVSNYTGDGRLGFNCSNIEPKSCPGNITIFSCCAHVDVPISSIDGSSSKSASTTLPSSSTFGVVQPPTTNSVMPTPPSLTVASNTSSSTFDDVQPPTTDPVRPTSPFQTVASNETSPSQSNSGLRTTVILGATLGSISAVGALIVVASILIYRRRSQNAGLGPASFSNSTSPVVPFPLDHSTFTTSSISHNSPIGIRTTQLKPGILPVMRGVSTGHESSSPGTERPPASLSDRQIIDRLIESIAVRFNPSREPRQGSEDGLLPPDYRSDAGR